MGLTVGAVTISVEGDSENCWSYTVNGIEGALAIGAPIFELNGSLVSAAFDVESKTEHMTTSGVIEYRVAGSLRMLPSLSLEAVFRLTPNSRIVRFRYVLNGSDAQLSRAIGRDRLTYARLPPGSVDFTEIRLSEFDELGHSYRLSEIDLAAADVASGQTILGPILVGTDDLSSWLCAYEHGSQSSESFLEFRVEDDQVVLSAVKGNYLDRQPLPFSTPWFQFAAMPGGKDAMAQEYRQFMLEQQGRPPKQPNPICYNTWALQSREQWWRNGTFLDPMMENTMLAEIDAAQAMGVEVFVLDTGWYQSAGDWQIDPERFTDSLQPIQRRLNSHGMELGLWFAPLSAAVSSQAAARHPDCRISWRGRERPASPLWGTGDCYRMCLVSRYANYFVDRLIDIARLTGATYFKWDGVGPYECDNPGHWHGDASHSPGLRAENCTFQLPGVLANLAIRLREAVPNAIVDFDVTESRRAFGLAFLSAGRYYLINHGPYYWSFDAPRETLRLPPVAFYPGPARARICRSGLSFDRWFPSTLFLAHYFPDDPPPSQRINLASMILGQNGIWGDLTRVSEEGVQLVSDIVARYKEVREDMTQTASIRQGEVGATPEIHEKIHPETGRGAVSIFSTALTGYRYITKNQPSRRVWHSPGLDVSFTADGRASISCTFEGDDAGIVFFS